MRHRYPTRAEIEELLKRTDPASFYVACALVEWSAWLIANDKLRILEREIHEWADIKVPMWGPDD